MQNKLIAFLLLFFPSCLFPNSIQAINNIKHVIVIGIDAMSLGGIMQANTPHFHEYMKNGAYSLHPLTFRLIPVTFATVKPFTFPFIR
jgi:hypothetical protein